MRLSRKLVLPLAIFPLLATPPIAHAQWGGGGPTTGPATAPADDDAPPPENQPVQRRTRFPRQPLVERFKPDTLTDEQVMAGIEKGVQYLLKRLPNDLKAPEARVNVYAAGRSNIENYFWTGGNYLMIYTLLHVGLETEDPRLKFSSEKMKPAVEWVLAQTPQHTYSAALQACALAQLPEKPEYQKALTLAKNRLVAGMREKGGYTYKLNAPRVASNNTNLAFAYGGWDNSNAQYGLLGVWMAAEEGVEVPFNYWHVSDVFWRKIQCADGGWDYINGRGHSTPSMTAAGVASLFVTQEYLSPPTGLVPVTDKALDAGLQKLIDTFEPKNGDGYYLYALERVGLASGLKFFGDRNWYREAAAHVLNTQLPDGSFSGSYGANISTSYAIMFLIRGRAPVIMNKLQYDGYWNARPRDSAHLTKYYARKFERQLNWQIVPLTCSYEEWLDAPILLITGSHDPKFSREDISKIRDFIQAGGMVFSCADGGSAVFSAAIKKYAAQIGGNQYEMRALPNDHRLFNVYAKMPNPSGYFGLSNGIRELWVHSTNDHGAAWQGRLVSKKDAWDFPANLYLYTTGKASLRSKLQPLTVRPPAQKPTLDIKMARVEYPGNWDPEPGAWARFTKIAATEGRTHLELVSTKINKLDPAITPVAHMTGTARFTLGDKNVAALKSYIDGGGTLLIDSCGGSETFAASAMELVQSMYPQHKPAPLETEHPLYKGEFSDRAAKIGEVAYRREYIERNGRTEKPQLIGVTIDGRVAVILSAEDITSGLLGTNTLGVMGYTPASAQMLAQNMVLYAANKSVTRR